MASKIRFLTDEHFRSAILNGVRRRLPNLDIIRVQDVGLRTASDPKILEFAALENRVLLTHDARTMEMHVKARLATGRAVPGVLIIRQKVPVATAIDEIVMVAECSLHNEWNGLIQFLPL